jgi:hypothetical protein
MKPLFAGAVLLVLGCSRPGVGWQKTEPSSRGTTIPLALGLLSGGRWAPSPDFAGVDYSTEGVDGSRRAVASGIRLTKGADGAVAHSEDYMPVDSTRAFDLPERLGGGHLFVGDTNGETVFWRAPSWTAPLVPLARVSDRVESIVVGFDRLYLELPLLYRWGALDLDSGEVMSLEPLPPATTFRSMAFVDAWFGAVSVDVSGVLVTFDAGASWHALDGVTSRSTVSARADQLLIENETDQFQLGVDGKLRRQASASGQELFQALADEQFGPAPEGEDVRPAPGVPPLAQPLRDAVLAGWPTDDGHALVLAEGALALVRLSDGTVARLESDAYPSEEPCEAVALGEGVGFICNEARRGTTLLRFEQPFGLSVVRRFSNTRVVRSVGNGALVISGDCAENGSGAGSAYCILHRGGAFAELQVRGDVGVERVAALRDESVVVLVPPRLGAPGTLTRIAGGQQTSVPLTLPETTSAFLQTGMWLDPLTELAPNVVGTWVAGSRGYHGVTVAADGKVTDYPAVTGASLSRVSFHGSVAFEVTPSGVVWVSTDFGKEWIKVDAPPSFYPLDERSALAALGPSPRVGCSHTGCAYGAWLYVGYPEAGDEGAKQKTTTKEASPPTVEVDAGARDTRALRPSTLAEAEMPKRVQFNPNAFFEWRPMCHSTGRAGSTSAELGGRLNQLANERPRRGLLAGFLPPLLVQNPEDVGGAVFRPFAGIAGPSIARAGVRFDEGREGLVRFRAYAWATSPGQWSADAAWQVRVQGLFDTDPVWATAPTFAPWPDVSTAAEVFGAKEGMRGGSEWTLELDPDEEGGILRVTSGAISELHVIGKGRATQSFGALGGAPPLGAVKVSGEWYFGQHEGDEFRIIHLSSGGPERVASFDVSNMHRVSVVRSNDAARLGVWIRTLTGEWYLYPLDDRFVAGLPLFVSRQGLNQSPTRCEEGASGWTIVTRLPATRIDPGQDAEILSFPDHPGMQASAVRAKVLMRDGSICLSDLAATVSRKDNSDASFEHAKATSGEAVPLTLHDPTLGRQFVFRCAL